MGRTNVIVSTSHTHVRVFRSPVCDRSSVFFCRTSFRSVFWNRPSCYCLNFSSFCSSGSVEGSSRRSETATLSDHDGRNFREKHGLKSLDSLAPRLIKPSCMIRSVSLVSIRISHPYAVCISQTIRRAVAVHTGRIAQSFARRIWISEECLTHRKPPRRLI